MHQAVEFATASEFYRKRPSAGNFRSEDKIFAVSFAKPFAYSLANSFAAVHSQLLSLTFAIDLVANFASESSGRVRIRIRIHSRIAATAVQWKEE